MVLGAAEFATLPKQFTRRGCRKGALPRNRKINATTPDAGLRGTDAAGFMTLPTGQESASLDFPKMDGREPMLGLHDPSCLSISLTSQRDCICRVLHFVVSMQIIIKLLDFKSRILLWIMLDINENTFERILSSTAKKCGICEGMSAKWVEKIYSIYIRYTRSKQWSSKEGTNSVQVCF